MARFMPLRINRLNPCASRGSSFFSTLLVGVVETDCCVSLSFPARPGPRTLERQAAPAHLAGASTARSERIRAQFLSRAPGVLDPPQGHQDITLGQHPILACSLQFLDLFRSEVRLGESGRSFSSGRTLVSCVMD